MSTATPTVAETGGLASDSGASSSVPRKTPSCSWIGFERTSG